MITLKKNFHIVFYSLLTDKYTAMYMENAACPEGNDVLLRRKMEALNLVSVQVNWVIYLQIYIMCKIVTRYKILIMLGLFCHAKGI